MCVISTSDRSAVVVRLCVIKQVFSLSSCDSMDGDCWCRDRGSVDRAAGEFPVRIVGKTIWRRLGRVVFENQVCEWSWTTVAECWYL